MTSLPPIEYIEYLIERERNKEEGLPDTDYINYLIRVEELKLRKRHNDILMSIKDANINSLGQIAAAIDFLKGYDA